MVPDDVAGLDRPYHARASVSVSWRRLKRCSYYLIERPFLFLPFEHSESRADQARSIALFEMLLAAAPAEQKQVYDQMLEFAVKHSSLIERFGRFPHRNRVLGRISTLAELAFIDEHGRGY
jgi:uncharacterized protein (DUF924 family)